jgi:cell division protein FtsW (lipid II flippase)
MNRNAEASLLVGAALLAALGVAMVNFTLGRGFDAQVALTFVVWILSFGSVSLALRRWADASSPYLLPLAAILAAIGFTEIYRLDSGLAAIQRWSLLLAGAAAALVLFLLRGEGVRQLRRYRYLFLTVGVLLLLLPLLPSSFPIHGAEVNGSRLWVRFQGLSFQPGELAKLFLAMFLASYLADNHVSMSAHTRRIFGLGFPPLRHFGPILIAGGFAFVVLVYQRDLGASLLLFALFVGMAYIATGRRSYLAFGGLFVAVGGVVAYQAFAHVQRRVGAWIDPFRDYSDSGYQIAQALFAMGSGSISGSGIGLGRPDLIPAASTDFIFAAVAEEMGFAGSVAVIAAYALLVAAGFGIALRTRDVFRKFLAASLTIVLAVQTILILAGVLRLFPVTGITLPFMSYGGSSLLANMILVALLARISHTGRSV